MQAIEYACDDITVGFGLSLSINNPLGNLTKVDFQVFAQVVCFAITILLFLINAPSTFIKFWVRILQKNPPIKWPPTILLYHIHHLKHRQVHRNDYRTDNQANDNNHCRFQEGG